MDLVRIVWSLEQVNPTQIIASFSAKMEKEGKIDNYLFLVHPSGKCPPPSRLFIFISSRIRRDGQDTKELMANFLHKETGGGAK